LNRLDGAGNEVQLLLDRLALRDLVDRYVHYIWEKDIRVVDLFSDDGEFGGAVGREALIAQYEGIFAGTGNPHPFATNQVVEFDGPDHAKGWVYLDYRGTSPEGRSMIGASQYNDEYVRVNGEWRFKRRSTTTHIMVPLLEGWAENPEAAQQHVANFRARLAEGPQR